MDIIGRIRTKLTQAFNPQKLEIIDDSHRHAGHAGARPGKSTHFRVEIVAAAFIGKGRLERQRLVYAVLAEELAGEVHALSLQTQSPDEAGLV